MKLVLFLSAIVLAAATQAAPVGPNCKVIINTCIKAGFKGGDWKNGDGLWSHCIDPVMGRPANPKMPPLKAGLTVPTVPPAAVQACLTENPNFAAPATKK